MTKIFDDRIQAAHGKLTKLENIGAPTVPIYDIRGSRLVYPWLAYGATYQVNRTIRAGDTITVDMSNSPLIYWMRGYFLTIKGLKFGAGPSITPWDDLPFFGSSGGGPGDQTTPPVSSFSVPAFTETIGTIPFGVMWRNTNGTVVKGGLRNYNLLFGAPDGIAAASPTFTEPSVLIDAGSLQQNYSCASQSDYYNWGVGTDSVAFTGGAWTWNLAGSPVPNNGFAGTFSDPVHWWRYGETLIQTATGVVDLHPLASDGISFNLGNGNILELGIPIDVPAPMGLALNLMAFSDEPPLTDIQKYPASITDDSTAPGPPNVMMGRAAESLVGPQVSLNVSL